MDKVSAFSRYTGAVLYVGLLTTKHVVSYYANSLTQGIAQSLQPQRLQQTQDKNLKPQRTFKILPKLMSYEEAISVLGLDTCAELTIALLDDRYVKLMCANQPIENKYRGSPYLQAKIHQAWLIARKKANYH